ncbi:MAG: 2'-5' RNA ligase family protein [Nitrososphaerota archaeon]
MEALHWAIVIFPDFAPAQRAIIDRIRAAYDPLAPTIEPHITLVFPFTAQLSTDELLAHMRSSAAIIAPFEITLRGITGEQDEWLFLNVKRGNDPIIALHDQLYSGPLAPYLEPRYTYVPHLTVGHLAPGPRFDAALREVNGQTETFHTTVRAITAYRIAGNERRAEKYSVALS